MLNQHCVYLRIKVVKISVILTFLVHSARLLIAIRTEITDNVEITMEKNGKQIDLCVLLHKYTLLNKDKDKHKLI